jgi:hypothetical protein
MPPLCRHSCDTSHLVLSCLVVPPHSSRCRGLSLCVVVDCSVIIIAHRPTVGCCVCHCCRVASCPLACCFSHLSRRVSHVVSLCCVTHIIIAHRPPPSCRCSCVSSRCISSCLVVSCLVVAPPHPSRCCGLSHCVVIDCRVVIVAHRPTVGCCVCRCHHVTLCLCPLAHCFWHLSRRVSRVIIAHRPPQTQPPSSSNENVSCCHCGKSQRVINRSHVDDATDNATSLSSASSVTGPPTPPTTPPIAQPYPPEAAVRSTSLTCSSKRHP